MSEKFLQISLPPLPTGVILAATPLGNVGDVSARLLQALAGADVVAAEDTRRARSLAQAAGVEISGKLISNFDHNEQQRAQFLVDTAATGTVLIISDAGMPLVSDPGHSIVAAATAAGVPVTCFPGPSAVPTALALSGMGVGQFIFDGFAPRKQGARRAWLESLQQEKRAVAFFESPHRIAQTLALAAEVLGGEREAAVCRELTKKYEEVKRGSLRDLAAWAQDGVRGEITVVISGATQKSDRVEDLLAEVLELVERGVRVKQACKQAAADTGVSNRDLYNAYLNSRGSQSDGVEGI